MFVQEGYGVRPSHSVRVHSAETRLGCPCWHFSVEVIGGHFFALEGAKHVFFAVWRFRQFFSRFINVVSSRVEPFPDCFLSDTKDDVGVSLLLDASVFAM